MRRLAVLVLLLAAALVFPTVGSGASPGPPSAHAAKKLKRCKPGANSKKCRCPKGQKLVKKGRKYRCKKKPTQQQGPGGDQQGTDNGNTGTGNTDPGTGGNTDPGTGTGAPPAQNNGAQTERDDAGYTAQLAGSRFGPRNDEGTYGYSTHTYDFCQNGTFSYHYEFVSQAGNGETYYNGNWQLEQGYRVIQSQFGPGWAGILIMTETDGSKARIEVDFNDTTGVFSVGTGSHFTGGQFQRQAAAC